MAADQCSWLLLEGLGLEAHVFGPQFPSQWNEDNNSLVLTRWECVPVKVPSSLIPPVLSLTSHASLGGDGAKWPHQVRSLHRLLWEP